MKDKKQFFHLKFEYFGIKKLQETFFNGKENFFTDVKNYMKNC